MSPKKLSFQDYILTPSLAREAGLMYVRQLRKDYLKQKQDIEKVISEYKSNSDLMKQKPHELLCPICLQLFSGPVTTSCNHTFCRTCIDESILFNPSNSYFKEGCPSCRNNIRAQELIVSKATQAIIRMLLYKLDTEEVQKFVKKQLQYQDWLERRTPKRSQLHQGQIIDVRDTEHVWCKGSIIEILPRNVTDPDKYEYLLVHYEGWASRFDQVISLQSLRLATKGFYMSRYEIPHYNLDPNNPQHYRCPVVTGPPPPVVPVVQQPQSESESERSFAVSQRSQPDIQPQLRSVGDSNSVMEDEMYFVYPRINRVQDQEQLELNSSSSDIVNNQRQINQWLRGSSSLSQGGNQSQYIEAVNRVNEDHINEDIYALSEPNAGNHYNLQGRYSNSQQQQQMQQFNEIDHNVISINQNRNDNTLRRDHSLPQGRLFSQLSQSQFGQMIHNQNNEQQQNKSQQGLIINSSEVDQQIINQINRENAQSQNLLNTFNIQNNNQNPQLSKSNQKFQNGLRLDENYEVQHQTQFVQEQQLQA